MATIVLKAETSGILSLFAELAEAPPEVRHSVIDLLESGEELLAVKSDFDLAAAAGEVVVRFDPSDRFAVLISAFRAGNLDSLALRHCGSSKKTVAPPSRRSASSRVTASPSDLNILSRAFLMICS